MKGALRCKQALHFAPNSMTLKPELIQPTASDFGSFVYCGAKLFLNKNSNLESFRKAKHGSYAVGRKYISRLLGQQNQYKCIEWILKKHKQPQNILFDGTGNDNRQMFPAKIKPFNVTLQCKPDLIIKRSDETILYEFKAVGDAHYLWYIEYDSVHAQIWCYRFIEHFKVDRYYLFRYFEDPFMRGAYPNVTELTEEQLCDKKFIPLFANYLDVIETVNNANRALREKFTLNLSKLNRPINQPDKCHNCIYYNIYCTPECELKR